MNSLALILIGIVVCYALFKPVKRSGIRSGCIGNNYPPAPTSEHGGFAKETSYRIPPSPPKTQ